MSSRREETTALTKGRLMAIETSDLARAQTFHGSQVGPVTELFSGSARPGFHLTMTFVFLIIISLSFTFGNR